MTDIKRQWVIAIIIIIIASAIMASAKLLNNNDKQETVEILSDVKTALINFDNGADNLYGILQKRKI